MSSGSPRHCHPRLRLSSFSSESSDFPASFAENESTPVRGIGRGNAEGNFGDDLTPALERYYEKCELHGVSPNGAVAIALQTCSTSVCIGPSSEFSLLDVLPICQTLASKDVHVTHLSFRGCDLGSMMMPALLSAFESDCRVQVLDLAYNRLDDIAAGTIAEMITECRYLKEINLRGNCITFAGAAVISSALEHSCGLKRIVLTNNYLGQEGVDAVLEAANRAGVVAEAKSGNFIWEEVWNSITHGFGVIWSIIVFVAIARTCSQQNCSKRVRNCLAIYAVTQLILFLCSCLFHSFHRLVTTSYVFGVLDHSAIYLLIAGTYTPFIGIHNDPSSSNRRLAIVWSLALAGIVLSIYEEKSKVFLKRCSLALYIIMGWLIVVWKEDIFPALTPTSIQLLYGGGIVYTAGVWFFLKGDTIPAYHVVWHVFVIGGAVMHFFSIWASLFGCGALYYSNESNSIFGCSSA